MRSIARSFEYIFSEDDWFNTVLVGGFFAMLSPLGFGLVMVMGFQVELTRRIRRGETGFPFWRNAGKLFSQGIRAFLISLWYAGITLLLLILLQLPVVSITAVIALLVLHFLLNPVIIRCYSENNSIVHCMNPATIIRYLAPRFVPYIQLTLLTTGMIVIASLLGWMWIVVGWTLLIFLMMIVQTISFAHL